MRTATVLLLALLSAACASQRQQQSAARTLALQTQKVQRDLQGFAELRAVANRSRQRSANTVDEVRLQLERTNADKLRVWAISDADRLKLFNQVRAATAAAAEEAAAMEQHLRENDALLTATGSRITIRNDQLTKTASTLAKLGEREKLTSQVAFYRTFWNEVKSSMENAAAAAQNNAAPAPAAAAGGSQ